MNKGKGESEETVRSYGEESLSFHDLKKKPVSLVPGSCNIKCMWGGPT